MTTDSSDVTVYGFLLDPPESPVGDLSPFCTKLLTFLKMTKTEYKYVPFPDHMLQGSPKGKMPWIHAPGILGDDPMADTSFIIDALKKADPAKYDLDQHLSAEEKAIGQAFKVMLEESLYWSVAYYRWTPAGQDVTLPAFFPGYHWSVQNLMGWYLNRNIQSQLKGQGTGLLTDDEITTKAKAEIKAFSDFLGTKKYILGNKISSYDATAYSFLVGNIKGNWEHPICQATKDCQNIVDYVERMEKEFWA